MNNIVKKQMLNSLEVFCLSMGLLFNFLLVKALINIDRMPDDKVVGFSVLGGLIILSALFIFGFFWTRKKKKLITNA